MKKMTNKFKEFDDLYIKINTGYMPSLLDFRRDRNQSAPAPKEMCGTDRHKIARDEFY